MKITIDTKEDSHEDIKKVVKMLQALLEGHTNAPMDLFSDNSSGSDSDSSGGLFNLFDDDKKDDSGDSTSSDYGSDDDETPRVITY